MSSASRPDARRGSKLGYVLAAIAFHVAILLVVMSALLSITTFVPGAEREALWTSVIAGALGVLLAIPARRVLPRGGVLIVLPVLAIAGFGIWTATARLLS